MSLLAPLICLAVAGIFMLFRAVFSAPEGEEDQHGFHLISPEEYRATDLSSFETLSAAELTFFKR